MKKIIDYYNKYPLTIILLVAFVIRMLSVFFAKGYGMHDDHFTIIETSRSWAEGWDFQGWLQTTPQGHSFFYPLLMYFLFKFLALFGIESLDTQMYFVRFVHCLLSLLTIYFSYKIAFRTSNNKKLSNFIAWTLALLWCMPWLSVRNLVEMVCMPFLLWSTWLYIRNQQPRIKDVVLSAIVMGIALAFRYQLLTFIGGFGLAMLIYKQWKNAIVWSIVLILTFSLTQISDIFIWGEPFVEMKEYFLYNLFTEDIYPHGGFFKYIFVLLGILLPPFSAFLLLGFFYGYKRLFLFLPSFCFLLLHSLVPNKQERFIFPIIPFIVILGMISCWDFLSKKPLYSKWRKTLKVCFVISLILNIILLIPVSVHYSKRSRVEAMTYMYSYRPNVKAFIHEDTPHNDWEQMPRIYTVQDCKQINVVSDTTNVYRLCDGVEPAFIIFAEPTDIDKRVEKMKQYYPNIEYATTIRPSFLDDLMRKINHHNHNYTFLIYRNKDVVH